MSGLEALKAIGELKENGVKINTTEEYKIVKNELNNYEEDKKELIAEQHRLFDLAKEQEEALKIIVKKNVFIWGLLYRKYEIDDYKPTYEYYKNHYGYFHSGYNPQIMTQAEFDLVKKVVEKYE